MTREFEADFATGNVQDASFTARPDAIVGRIALAPGPTALEDLTDGLKVKAWYARVDNTAKKVYLAPSKDDTRLGWDPEVELFTYTGVDVDALSLAFDASGRPVVAMERAGDLWVRFWNGASYSLTNTGAGTSPALVLQSPDSDAWRVLYLLYESGTDIKYRLDSDDYASSIDTLSNLAAEQRIERVILDDLNRVHLILSTRDTVTGRYSLDRITSDFAPPCMDVSGLADRVDDGIETTFIWAGDGEILVTCELEVDVLIIGAGGDSGGSDGDVSVFWASLGGFALDPDVDTAPSAHIGLGGGAGAPDDRDGNVGASGGGGGGKSPSGNSMFTQGGNSQGGQGNDAGGGRSSWGLLPRKDAASGGGGGYGGPGTAGGDGRAGAEGPGAAVPGWNWSGPKGGKGYADAVTGPETIDVGGGGGAGGVLTLDGFLIQPAQAIPIRPGQKAGNPGGNAGVGGKGPAGGGYGGFIAIRVATAAPAAPAVLSGGTEIVSGGYRYHIFTANGTITVSTPGSAEVLLVSGGGGGGSGSGAGGGGGGVRLSTINLVAPSEAVTVGAGGAGGVAAAVGANGGDSSVGILAVAQGGGGGAGTGTAAGDRATGGGGHGVSGDPGPGAPLRGYPGGEGGGFNLSVGGSSAAAGGGGGVGGPGDVGAEKETQGDELAEDWDASSTFEVNVTAQVGDETSNQQLALLSKNVSRGEMFVQGMGKVGHSDAFIGLAARASHPSGVDAAPDGNWCYFRQSGGIFGLDAASAGGGGISLATWYTMQLYSADGVQQAHMQTSSGERRVATATTTYDGQDTRSAGMRSQDGSNGTARRQFDDFMAFRSKFLTVGGIPTGGKAQILNASASVVAEALESSGEAQVDCSRYGDGATGVTEPVPMSGWQTLRVLDAGLSTVAEIVTGGIFPGDALDVVGSELEYRDLGGGQLELGLIEQEDFSRLTPGPENGDGGPGREVAAAWLVAAPGDSGFFGGGGGGGAELFIAGLGGDGGGGDGGVDTAAPTVGTDEVGGGGGGSGDSSVAGAAGGDGIVVLRTVI